MQFQQLLRSDVERVYIVGLNTEASSITTGYGAAYAIGGASFDGVSLVLTRSGTAANLPAFLGVAVADIAANTYGRIQTFGFAASVFYSNVGSSITINQGDPLVPGALAGGLFSLAPTYAASGFKFVLASNVPAAISASGWMSGLIKCLG